MQAAIDIADIIFKARAFRFAGTDKPSLMATAGIPDQINEFLDRLSASGLEFLVVGGIALRQYIGSRNTEDIDLIAAPDALGEISGIVIEESNPEFARARFGTLQVDILRAEHSLFAYILKQESTLKDFAGHSLPCATPRGLAILKLFALPSLYRQHDLTRVAIYEGDIAALVGQFSLDDADLLAPLESYLIPSDLGELRKILSEIRARLHRFDP